MSSSEHRPARSRGDAGAVGVGKLGEVAGAHQQFDLRPAAARLDEAADRAGEAEMDRVEHRIGDEGDAGLLGRLDGAPERIEIAGNRRDQHRRHLAVEGQRQRVLVEAEQVVRPCPRADPEFVLAGGIDADGKAFGLQRPHRLAEQRKRRLRQAAEVDDVGAGRGKRVRPRDQCLDRQHRRIDDLGEDPDVVAGKVGRLAGPAEERRQVGDLVRAAHERHAEMRRQAARGRRGSGRAG